jgi:hypothetical protein
MTTFYYYSVNHQSSLQQNTFSKLSYTVGPRDTRPQAARTLTMHVFV